MITRIIFTLSICLLAFARGLESSPQEEAEGLAQWKAKIEGATALPTDERIQVLQEALLKLSQPSIYSDRESAQPVLESAKKQMLVTPEFTGYYRATLVEMSEEGMQDGRSWNVFQTECGHIMQTLQLLPTPEVARLLAEMLDYDQTRDVPNEGSSLARNAAITLYRMIDDPPARDYPPPWKEWREDILAHRKTFRFKGSELRYDFDGPIETTKAIETKQSADNGRAPTPHEKGSEVGIQTWWAVCLVLILLVGAWVIKIGTRRAKHR